MSIKLRLALFALALPLGFLAFAPNASAYANTPTIDATYNNRIIDDDIALNKNSMTAASIQSFLNGKVPSCDTNHQGGLASSPPPYQCLRDYVDPTTGKSAAQLIYDEATAVGLNPQVILVTLQKEQSLVTDTWPYASQYKSAMGYGCPESQTVCDSQYYGFYNQVHLGARLLRAGLARNCGDTQTLPGWSIAGKWGVGNSPQVDGRTTFLSTCMTGALYNYTPHRPDSAYTPTSGTYYYGNYNFISYFTSWFGSTWSNKLVRGTGSSSVFLLAQSRKYYIGSGDVLDAFRNLAPVQTVDQGFLNTVTSGSDLSHFLVSSTTGAVYLVDAGNKLQFNTCADVAAYGSNCNALASVPDSVIYGFVTGPSVGSMAKNQDGVVYKVEGGKKRLISDPAIYHESGLDATTPLGLTTGFVNTIADGAPILKDQAIIFNQDTGSASLSVNGSLRYLPSMQVLNDWNFDRLPQYHYPNSMLGQSQVGGVITPFVSDSGHTYAIDNRTKRSLDATSAQWGSVPLTTALPTTLLAAVPSGADAGAQTVNRANGAVYVLEGGKKRRVPSGEDFTGLGLTSSSLSSLNAGILDSVPDGPLKLAPLRLITTGSNGLVVLIDGANKGWKVSSPDLASNLGLNLAQTSRVDQGTFDAYPAPAYIGQLWTDGTTQYIVDQGKRHLLSGAAASAYGLASGAFNTVSSSTANTLSTGAAMSQLIKGSGPSIYYIESGQKRHVQSAATYSTLSSTSPLQMVSDALLQILPLGPDR